MKKIELIKLAAAKMLPPEKPKSKKYNGADVDGDEKRTRDFLGKFGTDWIVTSERNKYERWDIEGTDKHNQFTRVEVKSRPQANTYPTWIIDSYKVDWLLDNHPLDNNYFVNVCEGRYELYDLRYIQTCKKVKTRAKMWNGGTEAKEFYQFDKKEFIIELSTGELGLGALSNESFGEYEVRSGYIG